jgi:hypothetical protein
MAWLAVCQLAWLAVCRRDVNFVRALLEDGVTDGTYHDLKPADHHHHHVTH